ncbi:MAG TPA: Calx-beta domain-containing protein [Gemmata sp.]|nr:Calx-beta domain-containing protein [Gemmata sp.]
MKFSSWLSVLRRGPSRRPIRRGCDQSGNGKLSVENLDARIVPAFLAQVDNPVGSYPYAAISADFNGDGVPDLATANYYSNTVSVLLGNPDGTFQSAVESSTGTYPLGSYPRSLAVGDFDGDSNLDIATVNSGGVSVLLGNGDGSFQAPSSINTGSYPASAAVGDFNGDGKMDLGVAGNISVFDGYYYGYYGGRYPHYHNEGVAQVLLGNGDGTFGAAQTTALGEGYFAGAAVGDFNSDGMDDFATTESSGAVDVLLADSAGSGNLLSPTVYGASWGTQSLALGDVNGDGISDLVSMNAYSVSALLGNGAAGAGDGTFQAAVTTNLDFYPTSMATGDFNSDGKLDLALSTSVFVVDYYGYYGPYGHYEGAAKVLLGYGNGHYTDPQSTGLGYGYAVGIASGEFNGDGFSDLAVANAYTNSLSVLINDQTWAPLPPPSLSITNATVAEGNFGSTDATFAITLDFAHTAPITVHFETADDSASAGSDYTSISGDVTFAPGETVKYIHVPVLGDRVAESDETYVVKISSSDAPIRDGQGLGTITDDEPRISIDDVWVTEGNTGSTSATFTVSLSRTYDQDVTVHYTTVGGSATSGSDFTGVSNGTVTIAAGQTSQTFSIAVLGDRVAEPDESFAVNLSMGSKVNALIDDGQGVGTILDNEPRITIDDVVKYEGTSTGRKNNTTQFVFTVSLSVAYDEAVTVKFSTADGSAKVSDNDYVATSGTVTFAPGETTKTITVFVKGDKRKESDEWFALNLSGPSTNAFLLDNQGIGWIQTDDRRGRH